MRDIGIAPFEPKEGLSEPPAKSQLRISGRELFHFLFDGELKGKQIAVLHRAYIDDSADRDRKLFVISGAIIGDESRWSPLYKPWRDRLAEDNLQYFKSSHCDTLNGQFHKFRTIADGRAQADKVRDDLDEIIRRLQLVTLGIILPIPVHQQMLNDPAKFGPLPWVPYRLAFQQVLAECAKAMRLLGRNNVVTFAHDDGDDFPQLHGIYENFKKKNPHLASVMADFVPLDDKLHPPLQAADVAASVTYRYAQAWAITPHADNLKRLRNSMYKVNIWGEGKSKSHDESTAPARCEYVIE